MKEHVEIVRGALFARNGGEARADGDLGPDDVRLVEIVGAGRRVLFLGLPRASVVRALQRRSCDLVLVHEGDPEAVRGISALCERVIGRRIGAAGLVSELGREEFDVVVLQGIAATAETLSELLPAVEHVLVPRGVVIGRPERRTDSVEPLATVLESAGFVVVRVDEEGARPSEAMTGDLLAAAARELEALALLAAFRCPEDELGLINSRLHALACAAEQAAAVRAARDELQAQADALRRELMDAKRDFDVSKEARGGLERHVDALEEAHRRLEQDRDIAQVDAANLRHTNKRLA